MTATTRTAELPTVSRAAVLTKPGQPLDIVDVPVPTTFEPRSLLVRTTAATVCATDVHLWEGSVRTKADNSNLPYILGHEMTGRVEHIAPGAELDSVGQPLQVGDRIVWTHGFCGSCHNCVIAHEPTLCSNRRGYMADPWTAYPHLTGGFSEFGYVFPTSGRIKVPDVVSDVAASAASCACRTVMHAFARLGPVEGRTVVIQGSGPVGLFALARAAMLHPAQLIVIGGPADRLKLAERWGATAVIDVQHAPAPADRLAQVRELTGGRGADVVVEASGARTAFTEGMAMLAAAGRYLVVGSISPNPQEFDASTIIHKQATILGSLSGSVEDYYHALQFMAAHASRFAWDDMISSHVPLDEINTALHGMRDLTEIKPAIDFSKKAPR
jgi:threonine dehydrogenase-like Zn-dependent dehydrogenase